MSLYSTRIIGATQCFSVPGYAATIGLLYFTVSVYSTLHIYFRVVNARRERGEEDWKREGKSASDLEEMGSNSPDYRYQV